MAVASDRAAGQWHFQVFRQCDGNSETPSARALSAHCRKVVLLIPSVNGGSGCDQFLRYVNSEPVAASRSIEATNVESAGHGGIINFPDEGEVLAWLDLVNF